MRRARGRKGEGKVETRWVYLPAHEAAQWIGQLPISQMVKNAAAYLNVFIHTVDDHEPFDRLEMQHGAAMITDRYKVGECLAIAWLIVESACRLIEEEKEREP